MEKEILIKGNLHIYDVLLTDFNPDGIEVHVEGDVFFHQKEDDFVYPSSDKFIENIFDKYDIKDIICYSNKFFKNQ